MCTEEDKSKLKYSYCTGDLIQFYKLRYAVRTDDLAYKLYLKGAIDEADYAMMHDTAHEVADSIVSGFIKKVNGEATC